MAGAGLRNSQFGRSMPYCRAKSLSAAGESKGWLKPMLMTLKRSAPMTLTVLSTAFCRLRVIVGQTWKAGGVDEGDEERLAAVARQFDRSPLAVEQDEVADLLADRPCDKREGGFLVEGGQRQAAIDLPAAAR
jgi:hypothetical protein